VDEDSVQDDAELDIAIQAQLAAGAARTSDSGAFTLTGLAAGTYVVWASHAGYARAYVPDVEVAVGSGADGVRLELVAVARLAGSVVGRDGVPITSYRLLLRGQDEQGRPEDPEVHDIADARGEFDLRDVFPGTYSLLAQADTRAAKLDGVTVGEGDEKTGLRLVAAPAVSIEGRVLDADARHAVSRAHVVVVGQVGAADTDDYGVYRIPGLAADGDVRLYTEDDRGDYLYDARSVVLAQRAPRVVMPDAWLLRAPGGVPPDGETGMTCESWNGSAVVTNVRAGSPAEAAGVRAGDHLLLIETTPATPFGDAALEALLRGTPNTSLTVTLGFRRRVSIILRAGAH
jgi:hypothetical protein